METTSLNNDLSQLSNTLIYENYFDEELQEKSRQIITKGIDCVGMQDFRKGLRTMLSSQQERQDPLLFFLALLILMLAFVLFVFFVFYSKEQQVKLQ